MRITREDVEDFQNPDNQWLKLLQLRKDDRAEHGGPEHTNADIFSKRINLWEMDQLTKP